MPLVENEDVRNAKQILGGQEASLDEILELAKRLSKQSQFGYARKLLSRAREMKGANWTEERRKKMAQEHALATYKDPDLPLDQKFDRAIAILEEEDNLQTTADQETLGLAGAIYKRMWEVRGQRRYLERSYAYYFRGYQRGIEKDQGYTAINAAFVQDLLANLEEEIAAEDLIRPVSAAARHKESKKIREEIIEKMGGMEAEEAEKLKRGAVKKGEVKISGNYWALMTLAEACIGLKKFDKARDWLNKAKEVPNVSDWQRQSSVTQFAALARLFSLEAGRASKSAVIAEQDKEAAEINAKEAREVLKEFLGKDVAVDSALVGKVGLALSGGGFRAALFHIGVLAKLADIGVLNRIEALSCVSGGSIAGAHYYLELRNLFKAKENDDQFKHSDYLSIVKNLESDFLEGVKKNIRTRVLAGWWSNVKMIFLSDYSRTMRVGELYEKHIFSRVDDKEDDEPRYLNKLRIEPKDEDPETFSPKRDNWRRKNKVPMLILNATSLNTGHNWQFTASFMGEPPAPIDSEVDANPRLRRMYYEDAPKRHQNIRLGYAVAASSCVPGLFEPLALPGLYEDYTVRLVDGGVFDNQGTASLLEQGCSVLLVSDASGQMGETPDPSSGELGVLLRSASVSQERVRHSQFRELQARRRSSLLQGLMFIHLKKDLNSDPVDWIDCPDPYDASADARPPELREPLTRYGVRKDLQRPLSEIRTDLDSFTEGEAYSLMTSGYFMTEHEFTRGIQSHNVFPDITDEQVKHRSSWRFLDVEEAFKQPGRAENLKKLLEAGGSLGFKIWRLSRPLIILKQLGTTAALALLASLLLMYVKHPEWGERSFLKIGFGESAFYTLKLSAVGYAAIAIILGKVFGPLVMKIVDWRKTARDWAVGLAMSSLGFVIARLHIWTFDKLFLRWGRLKNVLRRE
jgi:predicted acylesterase/phospholipase RssA